MPESKTYNPDQVSVIVGGRVLSGFANGTFITAERDSDNFSDAAGINIVSRSKITDKRGNITMVFQQTAPDVAYLSDLSKQDELDSGGIVSVLIRDASGNSLVEAAEAWLQKPTVVTYADELTNREYVLRCAELIINDRGN